MDAVASKDEKALRAQLRQARERLDGLVRSLRSIDDELEGLAPERKHFALLQTACGALEELGELGAAGLFWAERAGDREGDHHLRLVRSRLDGFQKRLGEIEDRRQEVLEEIDQQQQGTELLEDEVFELDRAEEVRRQEWIVERHVDAFPDRAAIMPWTHGGEEDRRLRKSVGSALAASLLLGLWIPQITLPLQELDAADIEVPERLTRLIMEARPLPPAPRVHEEAKPQPPEPLAEQPPQLAQESGSAKPSQGPGKGTGEGEGIGPAKGPGKGILAFREKFSGFKETQNVARLGSQARISNAGHDASAGSERAMVTTRAPGSSGGINLAALSRGLGGGGGSGGGGQLAGVQVARATSTIGGGGGARSLGSHQAGGGPALGRTDEEIQIVFDRHKAALYRLYNRELRNDPTLKGQMVLRLRIEPDGSVSLCELQGTDMRAPQLAAQVVERVRTFDFGAKEGIAAVTILYPIDFLPAT
jgi:hypothetical protein